MKESEELELLEVFEKEIPLTVSIDFWKLTNGLYKKIEVAIEIWNQNGRKRDGIKEFDEIYDLMLEEVRFFDKHGYKIDGTEQEDYQKQAMERAIARINEKRMNYGRKQ